MLPLLPVFFGLVCCFSRQCGKSKQIWECLAETLLLALQVILDLITTQVR